MEVDISDEHLGLHKKHSNSISQSHRWMCAHPEPQCPFSGSWSTPAQWGDRVGQLEPGAAERSAACVGKVSDTSRDHGLTHTCIEEIGNECSDTLYQFEDINKLYKRKPHTLWGTQTVSPTWVDVCPALVMVWRHWGSRPTAATPWGFPAPDQGPTYGKPTGPKSRPSVPVDLELSPLYSSPRSAPASCQSPLWIARSEEIID